MRLGLFGGTFNPVHNGHLLIAENARVAHRLDRVVFIPAGLPPHKTSPRTSAAHRLAMVRLAISGNPAFSLSPWEVQAKRVVYTYETVEHFQTLYPRASLFFLMGEDARKSFPRWKNTARIRKQCQLISTQRLPLLASHEIRCDVRQGRSIRYRVPEPVRLYIARHKLYLKPE